MKAENNEMSSRIESRNKPSLAFRQGLMRVLSIRDALCCIGLKIRLRKKEVKSKKPINTITESSGEV